MKVKNEDKEGGWCSEARVDAWEGLCGWAGEGCWVVGSKSDRLPAREDEASSLPAAEVISLEKARAFSPGSSFSRRTEMRRAFANGTIECIIVWFIIGSCLRATISHPQPSSTPYDYTSYSHCQLETLKAVLLLALIALVANGKRWWNHSMRTDTLDREEVPSLVSMIISIGPIDFGMLELWFSIRNWLECCRGRFHRKWEILDRFIKEKCIFVKHLITFLRTEIRKLLLSIWISYHYFVVRFY